MTDANHISHEAAHDALSDVYATIAMAKLVKARQPRLYEYVYGHRQKHRVAPLINLRERKPFLHVSSRLPRESAYTALMIPLCAHPTNKNAILAFNLSSDPEGLLTLDPEQIRERIFTPAAELPEGAERIAIKAVHINRCPVVATPKLLDDKAARRLGIDREVCERNWHRLKNADLAEKLAKVFSGNSFAQPADPEAALYGGFPSHADKALLARVRNADPGELPQLQAAFSDKRYRELLFRYRARYAPETLSDEEAAVWEEQRYQMLTDPDSGHLCLDSYFARLDELAADPSLPVEKQAIIGDLREWGDLILA